MNTNKGFTLVELLVAIGLSVLLFSSLVAVYMSVKSVNGAAKNYMQAMQVVRGQIELLKATSFNNVVNSNSTVVIGSGPDGILNTADDVKGTLTVTVQDFLDMDGDGITNETSINIDKWYEDTLNPVINANDSSNVKPVRVSLTWTQHILGQQKQRTVYTDTLLSN